MGSQKFGCERVAEYTYREAEVNTGDRYQTASGQEHVQKRSCRQGVNLWQRKKNTEELNEHWVGLRIWILLSDWHLSSLEPGQPRHRMT